MFIRFVIFVAEFVFGVYKVGYDLNGERMPELRSGARRSKRLGDLQPGPLPVDQEENWAQPEQNRTRRRVGGGRGRGGNATGVGKGSSPAVPTRRPAAGRGRGARLIDLDPEPCEVLPVPVALRAQEPVYNHLEVVANNNIVMEGGSGDKVAVAEEEATTTPVPERVCSLLHIASLALPCCISKILLQICFNNVIISCIIYYNSSMLCCFYILVDIDLVVSYFI